MVIESSADGQVLPARRLTTGKGHCIAETPIRDAKPPFWNLLLDDSGRGAIAAAQRAIFNHSPSSEDDIISDILRDFASWVLDLPASENNHHAYPNGLYRHSLEVASYAVQKLKERWSRGGGCAVLTLAEQAFWMKVTFAMGLFHDCGKILDIEVRLSESGPRWDPLIKSLAAFKARHGVDALAPTPHTFRRGRGLHGHEQRGISLLPIILADRRWDWLRPPLAAALAALASRLQGPIQRFPVPLAYLAEGVHWADIRSAQQGMRKLRK